MRKRCVWTTTLGVLGCTLAGVCGPREVRAQEAVTIDVADCIKLASPGDRLNCYERHAEAAQKAAPPAAPASQAVSPGSAPAATAASPPRAAPPSSAVAPAATAATAAVAASGAGAAPAAAPPAASSSGPAGSSSHKDEQKTLQPDIVATITELRVTVPNSYRITLDNGQVWQQTYPELYALQTGQRVTLQASKWGKAYRLSGEGMNGFIQVQRVR